MAARTGAGHVPARHHRLGAVRAGVTARCEHPRVERAESGP